jgi:hypothetical protein
MRLLIILLLFAGTCFSQKVLDMNYFSLFGKEKTFQFFLNREFSYKLKGHFFCKTKTIVNMNDSLIAFTDETIIRIDRIKGVKIKGGNFSRYLFGSAVLFPLLDIANNVAFDRRPIVNERALNVGGIFLAAGVIVNYIQDKHIPIRKNTTFRVFDPDYEHLNVKK